MSTLIHFVREKNIRDKFFCTADPQIIDKVVIDDEVPIAEGTQLRIYSKNYIVQSKICTTEDKGSINEWESHYYGKPAEYDNEVYFDVELKAI